MRAAGMEEFAAVDLRGYVEKAVGLAEDAGELGAWFHRGAQRGNLPEYLEGFAHTTAVMQEREGLERIAFEFLEDMALDGVAGRHDGRGGEDDFIQAGNLFRILSQAERQDLFDNLSGPLSQVPEDIRERQLAHFDKADLAYGTGVRAALGRKAAA